MEGILKYFPNLSDVQIKQFSGLKSLYQEWNKKINIISRKDISHLYLKHVLHSLSIAKVIQFQDNSKILDVGTGGGFPGIPLAIMFPNVEFVLVDSIAKKIKVVEEIVTQTKINNIQTLNDRAERVEKKFDFVVSRAVTRMSEFKKLVKGKFYESNNHQIRNGILYLKGGDLRQELKGINHTEYLISQFFEEDFFKDKKIVHVSN